MIEPGQQSLLVHFVEEHVQWLVRIDLLVHGWVQPELQELGVSVRFSSFFEPLELDFLLAFQRREQLEVDGRNPFVGCLLLLAVGVEVGYDLDRRNCSALSDSSVALHFYL